MKPVDQVYLEAGPTDEDIPPPDKHLGDCWRASIASALELAVEEVPHFAELGRERWWPATNEFLEERGLTLIEWDLEPEGWAPPGITLLSGESPRGDFDHTVVGRGSEIIHDPHPSRAGLKGAPNRIAVFVALDPSISVRGPLNPVVEGHYLVVPIEHAKTVMTLDPWVLYKTMDGIREIAERLMDAGVESFNLIQSNGGAATQTVPHVHFHIVPRHEGDNLQLPWSTDIPEESPSSDRGPGRG
jgi:diadenosine tetraphosphate (Ap4A) HIT family hydrolase